MSDKVVFVCVVLIGDNSENFAWSQMYVNVEPQTIHDEIYNLVQKFPELLEREIHMKQYGFDDEDEYHETYWNVIKEAIHGQ